MISLYGESTKNLKLSTRGREVLAEIEPPADPDSWRYEHILKMQEHWLPVLQAVAKGEDKVIGVAESFPIDVDTAEDLLKSGYIYKPGTWYGTPGPWLASASGNDNVTDVKGRVICGISNNVKRPPIEKRADLRLIAKAPAMREALIQMQKWLIGEWEFSSKPEPLRIVNNALEGLKGEE